MSQPVLVADALVIRATFRSPSAKTGIELESFASIAEGFDLTLGTAWVLGAEKALRMKTLDVDIPNALARWRQTGLLGMVARHRLLSPLGDSISLEDPAMPRVTFLNVGPPLDVSILLPVAFLTGVGIPAVSCRMLERVFRTSSRIKAKQGRLEAEIAEWQAVRSPEELRVIDAAADEIASPPRPMASRLEMVEPDSDGH